MNAVPLAAAAPAQVVVVFLMTIQHQQHLHCYCYCHWEVYPCAQRLEQTDHAFRLGHRSFAIQMASTLTVLACGRDVAQSRSVYLECYHARGWIVVDLSQLLWEHGA